jgi:hypothetical protein
LFKAAYYSQRSRVFVENFAAKLPTSPQLTVLEYSSSVRSRSSQCQNIKSSNQPTKTNKQASSYSKHTSWKKTEHFFDVDIE